MTPALARLVHTLAVAAVEEEARLAHRPTDRAALAAEARRLVRQGLTCADVAASFGLTEAAVRALLREPDQRDAA